MAQASFEQHKEKSKGSSYNVGVIIASTSRYTKYGDSDTPEKCDDVSGKIIVDALMEAGHKVAYKLLPDDRFKLESAIMDLFETSDAVIICGGTGLTASDVTIEAVMPMLDKTIPGFGELFRIKSYEEVGTASVLTRAMAGVIRDKAIFCIPGSPNAAKLGVTKIIIPELGHIISHIRKG